MGVQRFVKVLLRVNLVGVNGIITSTQAKFVFGHAAGFLAVQKAVSKDSVEHPRMAFREFCHALECIECYTSKSAQWLVNVVVSGSHRAWDTVDAAALSLHFKDTQLLKPCFRALHDRSNHACRCRTSPSVSFKDVQFILKNLDPSRLPEDGIGHPRLPVQAHHVLAVPTTKVVEGAFEFICHPPSSHLGVPDYAGPRGALVPVSETDEPPKPEDTDAYHHRIHFNQFQLLLAYVAAATDFPIACMIWLILHDRTLERKLPDNYGR